MDLRIYKSELKLNTNVPLRTETMDNKQYTVVPVVMMTVGVHAGSGGPLLYTAGELAHFHQAWNGEPICIEHPVNADGVPVSANSPEFYNNARVIIGKVFNAVFEDDKLKAEAWLETDKSTAILSYLNAGNQLEVSTGLFSDDISTPGDFNGERYDAIATNIRPDHLALLPGGTGACSWQDGCGIRANEEEELKRKKKEVVQKTEKDILFNYLEEPNFTVNETDYLRLVQDMRSKIDSLDVQGEKYCYLRVMKDNHVIYMAEYTDRDTPDKLYTRDYNIVNDQIEWTSDPVEVQEVISYPPVANTKTNEGDKTVEKKKDDVCCLEEVKAFVANEDNKYTETDIDWLSKLEEGAFKSIVANSTPEEKEVIVEKEVEKASTIDQVLANTDSELGESLKHGLQVLKDRKVKLIEAIKGNASNQFTDEDLNAAKIDFLERIAGSFAIPVTNHIGMGGEIAPQVNAENEQEALPNLYDQKEEK